MGYEVSYNEFDYAEANDVCQRVVNDLEEAQVCIVAVHETAEQTKIQLAAMAMGGPVAAYSPSLDSIAMRLRGLREGIALYCEDSRRLAEAIGQARGNYAAAEARVEHQILATQVPAKLWESIAGLRENGMRPPTEDMETMLRLMMFLRMDFTLGWNDTFGDQMEDWTKLLSNVLRYFRSDQNKEIVITQKDPPEYVEVDGGVEGYYDYHSMLEDQGPEENGKFMVVQRDNDSYVVVLPGTQNGEGFENPFDEFGISDAFGVESENYADAIAQALEDSGAKEGAEVTFSGYSQGGIHAAQLMKNSKLKRKFKLTKMITFGSPIANIDIPDDVRSLSLTDSKDMVPGLDGTPNKNRGRHHFTVNFDGPSDRIKRLHRDENSAFGTPHKLNNYGDHLQELELDSRPEVREQLDAFRLPTKPLKVQKFKIERRRKQLTDEQVEKQAERMRTVAPGH
ncbi:hypothetical protein [Glutamicibacter sp. JC586]|uniref:hypothetical protein n=1 Tax=Glutamicibacter sp. JC586 TaxID=2590552 RepID=UPI001359FA87|nr:hypothetical protein [Glutamicibacter sp. JC586]